MFVDSVTASSERLGRQMRTDRIAGRGKHLGIVVLLQYMLGLLIEGLEDGQDYGKVLPAGLADRVVAGVH